MRWGTRWAAAGDKPDRGCAPRRPVGGLAAAQKIGIPWLRRTFVMDRNNRRWTIAAAVFAVAHC